MITSRQQFLDTLDFKPVATPLVMTGFPLAETRKPLFERGCVGTPVPDLFQVDRIVPGGCW
jgi:hypothetical protein